MNVKFTPREISILNELIKGMSYKEISEKLYISVPTVKYYMGQISEKLGIHRKVNVILFLLKNSHLLCQKEQTLPETFERM